MLSPKFLAASVAALGIVTGGAYAQGTTRPDPDTQFQSLDKDNKGYLTRTDVSSMPAIAQRFAQFDGNRDGKLDRAEFAALLAGFK